MDLVVGPWGARPVGREPPETAPTPEREGRFACANCGAVLSYAPGTETLRCAYCGHDNHIEASDAVVAEAELAPALARIGDAAPPEAAAEARCDGCGAGFRFAPPLHAGPCPFCGQAVVTAPTGTLTPSGLLPFLIGEANARERINGWLERLWFAPGRLRAQTTGRDRLHGLYIPAFTFDSRTQTRFQGQRGDVYYETRRVPVVVNGRRTTQLQRVPKVRWRPVAGEVSRDFDDLLVLATSTLPPRLAERLRRFDTQEARPYQADFLAGFESELYQRPLADAAGEAQRLMRAVIQGDVKARIGGDMQRITAFDVRHADDGFKLVLVPLWRADLRFLGRIYRVLVNGRTGEVLGERPYSFAKIALAVLAGLAVLAALATFFTAMPDGPYLR